MSAHVLIKFRYHAAIDLLKRLSWPGNIRQLENAIQRLAASVGDVTKITDKHISQEYLSSISIDDENERAVASSMASLEVLRAQLQSIEKAFWENQIQFAPDIRRLSETTKIPPATLYRKFKSLNIIRTL
jgi:DNA-binding NtrC family response regulator